MFIHARWYVLLAAIGSFSSAQAQSHVDLVNQTPCLMAYRTWFFGSRGSAFTPPPGLTAETCDKAREVHERIRREQAAEVEEREQQRARETAERQARLEAEQQREARQHSQQQAQRRKLAEELARRPPPSIGMTAGAARNQTNWGKPQSINRTTTAQGVREQWVYGPKHYLYFENGRLTAIQD